MSSAHRYTWTRTDRSTGKAWRACWVGPDGKVRRKRGFDREADAKAYAADREAEARHGVALGGVRPTGRTTVEAWSAAWLDGLDVRPSSEESYRYAVKRINATLGGRALASLRPSEVKAWRRALLTSYAPSTAEQTSAVLAMMLRAALLDGLIERSPMPPARAGAGGRVVDPNELLTLEQVRAWGRAMTPEGPASPRHRQALPVANEMPLVAAQLGLRRGELLGLRPEDVDFLRRQVRVNHQLLGTGQYGPTKTPAGVRTLPLTSDVADALNRHLAVQPAVAGEPIFRSPRGRRWQRSSFWETWEAGRARADLPGWVTWHSLRDVYASSLIWLGQDLRVVMTLLGHSSSEETLRTYARLWPTSTDTARKALEGLWRPANDHSVTTDEAPGP